jgi:WXG100 family type VII secretion target
MSYGTTEMGQGDGTLSRAAGLVASAHHDFEGFSRHLDGQLQSLRGRWTGSGGRAFFALHQVWSDKQRVITGALHEFEAALLATERDNLRTDEHQSATYHRTASRLG